MVLTAIRKWEDASVNMDGTAKNVLVVSYSQLSYCAIELLRSSSYLGNWIDW